MHGFRCLHDEAAAFHGTRKTRQERLVVVGDQKRAVLIQSGRICGILVHAHVTYAGSVMYVPFIRGKSRHLSKPEPFAGLRR